MGNDSSLFRMISVGTVAENKLRSSTFVEVSLNEVNPYLNGELKSDIIEDTAEGVDRQGNRFTVMVQMANTIRAEWKGDGTNRVSAPDVRRGERVEIWQYSNTDKYYWVVAREPGSNVRRLETVIQTYNNSRDENQTESTKENSWYSEISTHDGHATFKTNKSNGEQFAYTVQLDAKNGNLVVTDDAGLYIQANSGEQHVEVDNGGGSYLSMRRSKVTCKTTDFELFATNTNINSDNITFKGNKFAVNMGQIDYSASNWKINSNVTINGSELTHNGKNVGSTHFHIGNLGRPVSPPQ